MMGSMNQNMMMNPAMMQNMGGMNQNMMMNPAMMQNMGMMGGMNQNMMMNPAMMQNMGMMGGMNQNMMMNPAMMQNMGMMGANMGGMDPNMMMNMMNMGAGGMPGMMNVSLNTDDDIADAQGWNLIFENQNDRQSYTIKISEQKLVKEAIDKYRKRSKNIDKCKFIYNSKELYSEMRICESGLINGSKILVISIQNLKGA